MKNAENELKENLENLQKKMKLKEDELNSIKTKLEDTEKNR